MLGFRPKGNDGILYSTEMLSHSFHSMDCQCSHIQLSISTVTVTNLLKYYLLACLPLDFSSNGLLFHYSNHQ